MKRRSFLAGLAASVAASSSSVLGDVSGVTFVEDFTGATVRYDVASAAATT